MENKKHYQPNIKNKPFTKIFNLRNFNRALFAGVIFLAIAYVAGANDLAVKGYALSDVKKQQSRLADENQKLELQVMSLSSYSAVSQKVGNLKMVAVGEIKYINNNGVVAKK
ncbi:MAG: hypothetical protein PHS62_04310 [Patescibacteria group bacterium]|nr:hypothetical protein [Patescibacteria group bacterium]